MTKDASELLAEFDARPSRRHILRGFVALGVGTATLNPLARALAAATDDQVASLTLMTQGGPVVDILNQVAQPLFAKNNPETEIALEVSSATVTYPKMIATRNEPVIAGGMFNDLYTALGNVDGMWAPVDASSMLNAQAVPQSLRSDTDVVFQQTPYGIMYNPDFVEKPTSWLDLFKPEYKGRVSMWTTNLDAYAMAGVATGAGFDVAAGIKAWEPYKQNVGAWVTSPVAEEDLVARGEIWLAPHWGAWAEQAKAQGKNVEFTIPEEGGTMWSNHACTTVNQSEAATRLTQVYLDTWFAPETQKAWLMKTFISPAVPGVDIPAEMLANPAVVTPEEASKLYRIPSEDLAKDFKKYNMMITRQLKG